MSCEVLLAQLRAPNLTTGCLTGGTHDAHLDDPDAWTRAIRAFLHPATTD